MLRAAVLLGRIWASPYTLLGLVIGGCALARPRVEAGALEIDVTRTWVQKICDLLGVSAFTLGDCVLYAVAPNRNIRTHERRHIQQYWVLGPLFLPVYYLLMALYGYARHPLERDARAYEQLHCGTTFDSRLM